MKITKKYDGKRLLLLIDGRIDTITSQELEKEINEELGDFESLTLDFNDLKYISSAGLRVLIITQKKLNDENIPFEIINVNGTVGEIIQMSGFDKILTIK
ncbi:STAS domain-containing protein [Methanobrevibacter sp.]|uniref:STAS domain-containing protein n=1 Tax=Methanobrevibacter sp. TaxID=66852 RepID=UPI002E78FA5E|nr:STAS domain-containing protein [Methanobrevibacter sp.]MEE1335314.1 STAS domain-containing protein [Methanobrevibacter sp.]